MIGDRLPRLRVKARREQAGELRKLQSLGLESIDLRQGQSVAQQVVRLNRPALVTLRAQDLEQVAQRRSGAAGGDAKGAVGIRGRRPVRWNWPRSCAS